MLQIIDINSNSDNVKEVESIKAEFWQLLSPTVHEGTIIIISDFPAVGNMAGKADYLILLTIKKQSGNYYRIQQNGRNQYIDNFVYLVKKHEADEVIGIDDQYLYSHSGIFDYLDSIKTYIREFENHIKKYDSNIKCFASYQLSTKHFDHYKSNKILVNHKINASYILWSVTSQFEEKNGDFRINSFSKEKFEYYHDDILINFAKELVQEGENISTFGILTKRRIDRISTSIKIVNAIYENIGKTLSIITGKAGTGKTLTLLRVIHKHANSQHNVRFLTFNNLLVFDIKQNLRNFGYYSDRKIAIGTVHQFFYRISQKLGISLLLSENRIRQLVQVCEKRVEKMRLTFDECKNSPEILLRPNEFLREIGKREKNNTDFDEFREFAWFMSKSKNINSFDEIKTAYLFRKLHILAPSEGQKVFLEDYYRILELIYQSITDTQKVYEDLHIKDRYDLLSVLYNTDKFTDENEIPYENFEHQVKTLKRISNWSSLLIVDECQDFHVLEKEILYNLRGTENIVVATGGKEQLIRHPRLLNWGVSLGKKVQFETFALYEGSFRQKQNIISFVNKFSDIYDFRLNLKSVAESKGRGKIIIDCRKKDTLIREDILVELKGNGEINGCSIYEGLMILIPSRKYTGKQISDGFIVNEKDYIKKVDISTNRHTINLDTFDKLNIQTWDGVSENKAGLRVPNQNESRIIHYESCRGLESWTCACMSLDEYFAFKRETTDASNHLADDLLLTEETRRDRYAAVWCLMAFTRPIDTLYIHLEDINSTFSKMIIQLAQDSEGVIIYNEQ